MEVFKSIIVQTEQDTAIIKHHIQDLDMMFDCKFTDNIIDFYERSLYITIKEFINKTKIKSKINRNL